MLKNITLSADEILIDQARKKAGLEKTSINKLFRKWIFKYVNRDDVGNDYDRLMETLAVVNSGNKFTREEMNER